MIRYMLGHGAKGNRRPQGSPTPRVQSIIETGNSNLIRGQRIFLPEFGIGGPEPIQLGNLMDTMPTPSKDRLTGSDPRIRDDRRIHLTDGREALGDRRANAVQIDREKAQGC